jgi:hypothetical protein
MSDHILLEEVAGNTYLLHYVETLCIVWPVLHTTVSSSADTAPGSLSKPAHHTHTHTMSVGKPTLSNKSVMAQTADAN